MSTTKRISIDEVTPGMFILDVNLPWYRTPFLFHSRVIEDLKAIQQMKDHGITTVMIDTSKGRDVADVTNDPVRPSTPAEPAADTSAQQLQPQTSAEAVYSEAHEAVDRIFADLERGLPPTPAKTKAIVERVLAHVLDRPDTMIAQGIIQKMRDFDRSLAAHALDVCILALVVAVEQGVDPALYDHVGAGALLHDVGYVRLPRNLVRKRSDCTEPERRLLQKHPQLGVSLLREHTAFPEDVLRIVQEHHEYANGSGYPSGISATSLSPLAQLVGIVNFYDSLVCRRGGRPAMNPHDAIRQLFLAGEQQLYAKSLVETVIRSIGVYPVGSLVRLNTGEQAIVVGANPTQRLKPQVRIIGGPQGESYTNPERIDLAMPGQYGVTRTILRVLDPMQERVNVSLYLSDVANRLAS
ncbi:MAG: DUF3391 domain-containing protein [Nitrospira sp.]|jgi:putative nucleotidyltransferase with HDIG domain|nr:DUF3391 domain-containing protein [Nitrospira sp.]